MSKLNKDERECHMRISEAEDGWHICTDHRPMITKLKNAGWPVVHHAIGGSLWFLLPYKAISIRSRESIENPKGRGFKKDG